MFELFEPMFLSTHYPPCLCATSVSAVFEPYSRLIESVQVGTMTMEEMTVAETRTLVTIVVTMTTTDTGGTVICGVKVLWQQNEHGESCRKSARRPCVKKQSLRRIP